MGSSLTTYTATEDGILFAEGSLVSSASIHYLTLSLENGFKTRYAVVVSGSTAKAYNHIPMKAGQTVTISTLDITVDKILFFTA